MGRIKAAISTYSSLSSPSSIMVKWKALRPYSSRVSDHSVIDFYSNVLMLNEQEFIVFIVHDENEVNERSKHIYKCHVQPWHAHGSPWTIFSESKVLSQFKFRSMAIDQTTNHLFLAGPKTTLIMDITSGSIVHKTVHKREVKLSTNSMVNANGVIHKIVWDDRVYHQIWDQSQQRWMIQQIPGASPFGERDISLIHVASKNMILMIGGRPRVEKWEYRPMKVWRYHIAAGQWEQLRDIELKHFYWHCVLSADERYVIIMRKGSGSIYAMDITDDNDYKIWKSLKVTPQVTEGCNGYHCSVAKTGGKGTTALLASGWIRGWRRFFPKELTEIISGFCLDEMIHWMSPREHRVMQLSQILSGMERVN